MEPRVSPPQVVPTPYRQLLAASASASTSAASGTKYLCRGGTDAATVSTSVTSACLYLLTAADLAITGLTTKLRVVGVVKTATAPAITITIGLYPVTAAAASTAGTVIAGSEVTITTPAANSDVSGNSGDLTLPADGLYILGYTVSNTPSGAFGVHAFLQARNVI